MKSIFIYFIAICSLLFLKTYSNAQNYWIKLNPPDSTQNKINSLVVTKNHEIYVAMAESNQSYIVGDGKNWQAVSNDSLGFVARFARSKKDKILANTTNGVFLKEDSGWKRIYNNGGVDVLFDNQNDIFLLDISGIIYSKDDGLNWRHIESPWVENEAIAVSDSGYIYVSGASLMAEAGSGLKRTRDYGNTWEDLDLFLNIPNQIVFNKQNEIFVKVYSEIRISRDNGRTWAVIFDHSAEYPIVIIRDSTNHILAGTNCGVYYFRYSDSSWVPMNNGLEDSTITAIAVSPDSTIYIGTKKGNVYRSVRPLGIFYDNNNLEPQKFFMAQNYPNPFNALTKIEFKVRNPGKVQLKIYSLNGKLIRSFPWRTVNSGNYSVLWDGKNQLGLEVSSGIYFYMLSFKNQADGKIYRQFRKMIFAK